MEEVGAFTPPSKVMSSAEMPTPINPRAMFFLSPKRHTYKANLGHPIFKDITDTVAAEYDEAVKEAMTASNEASKKRRAFVDAQERQIEASINAQEANLEALEALQRINEASVQLKNTTDKAAEKKYEDALLYAQEAQKKAEQARDEEKAMILAARAASQENDQAQKALEKAYARAQLMEKTKISWKGEVWEETDRARAAEAAPPEDTVMSRNYSKYVSYTRDERCDHPIMSWTLSQEHLEKFQEQFIIARQLGREQVMAAIYKILEENARRIKAKQSFYFKIPKRKAEFLQYSKFLAMPLLLRGHSSKRSFTDARTKRRACMTAWLLSELYISVRDRKFLTLREIYYRGRLFFKKPKEAAELLADICCMLECTASSLNVIADLTGSVIGGVTLKLNDGKDDKDILKCHLGMSIPYNVNDISEVLVDDGIRFVLVVEKGTIYNHLRQADIPSIHHCLMVTAYGMPDERTRSFVRLLEENTNLPIFGLTDPDPYGIGIMKTYAKGSTNLAHSNLRLAVPAIHWLGITTCDIKALEVANKINVLNRCPLLNSKERVMLRNMMVSKKYQLSGEWKRLIKDMLDTNRKACFEVLHVFGSDFVTDVHVPFLIDRVMKCLSK